MRRLVLLAVMGCAVSLGLATLPAPSVALASQGGKNTASSAEGRKLFNKYCASCHGEDGKGQGPVAPTLKTLPADLTRIPLENGKFPAYKIEEMIAGEQMSVVHGTREMPVWGSIIRRKGGEGLVKLELFNLTSYIKSIQQK